MEQYRRDIMVDFRKKMDLTKIGKKRMSVQIGKNRANKGAKVKTWREGEGKGS